MIPDSHFQQALDGTLSAAAWRELSDDPTERRALAEQMTIDAALRVAFEKSDVPRALEEAVLASVETADSRELERRILASTKAVGVRWRRPLPRHRVLALAAVMLVAFAAGWLAVRTWDDHSRSVVKVSPPEQKQVVAPPVQESPVAAHEPGAVPAVPEEPRKSVASIPPVETGKLAADETTPPRESSPPLVVAVTTQTPPSQPLTGTSPSVVAAKLQSDASADVVTLPSAGEKVQFEKHILPLLERSCFECHSAKLKKPKGGIRFDDLSVIRSKSKTDNLVFPHKPARSTLLKAITLSADDDNFMPPTGKGQPLSAAEVAVVKRWIEEGANFGSWTSVSAKTTVIRTKDEVVDVAHVKAVARRIDDLLAADLQAHHQAPGELTNDATFVRRVYLDLIGRIPSFDETQKFLGSKTGDKRAKLIDSLLASNGHVSHMFNFWADLLRAREKLADNVDGKPYLTWIKQSIRDNKPYDQWVREMLSPEGFGWKAPAAGYYLRDGANRPANIEATATLFLGTQISCAQCHDHPFDKWTRMDYHQFLAFTSGIKASNDDSDVGMVSNETIKGVAGHYGRLAENMLDPARKAQYRALSAKVRSLQAKVGGAGVVNGEAVTAMLPADYQYDDAKPGQAVEPKVLFGSGEEAAAARPADGLAHWVTSPRNGRFNLAIANRLWAKLFGLPFAGRVDQIKDLTDCDNPDLAAYLANLVRDSHYDLRQVLRIFANTQAYQNRAHLAPESAEETYRFPSPIVRRLSAEQVWDSMMTLAVSDLDSHIGMENQDISKLEEAVKAKTADDVSKLARQMVREDQRKAEADARKSRKFGDLAAEFAGGLFERASELPQPTPPGHFLNLFGQGNRDFIGDTWSASTVPQALLMMNSRFFDYVARSGRPLANALREARSPKDFVRNAFLAVLSREPTQEELAAALQTLAETQDPKSLARTLLTTAEFVFQK